MTNSQAFQLLYIKMYTEIARILLILVAMYCCVSAGVGRSGAYIALDSLLDQANAESQVDVYAFTSSMRKSRANMIQTVVSCHSA